MTTQGPFWHLGLPRSEPPLPVFSFLNKESNELGATQEQLWTGPVLGGDGLRLNKDPFEVWC